MRGKLIAQGTATDSIRFTSNTVTAKGSWNGILVRGPLGGNASFSYCSFSYASSAISEECCGAGNLSVQHSSFISNRTALDGYSGMARVIDRCYFKANTYAVRGADKTISNSVFISNDYGLSETERVSVSASTFTNHAQAALYGGRGSITNSSIRNNNIGVKAFFEGFTISNSTISDNELGIELGSYDSYIPPVSDNKICNNRTFNVKNNSSYNVALYNNCWCSSDSTTVENKIFDGWDDQSYGLVDYMLYSNNCEIPIYKTIKLEHRVAYFIVQSVEDELYNLKHIPILHLPDSTLIMLLIFVRFIFMTI